MLIDQLGNMIDCDSLASQPHPNEENCNRVAFVTVNATNIFTQLLSVSIRVDNGPANIVPRNTGKSLIQNANKTVDICRHADNITTIDLFHIDVQSKYMITASNIVDCKTIVETITLTLPTHQPTFMPSMVPSMIPSSHPSEKPLSPPTKTPTNDIVRPPNNVTQIPSSHPSETPTAHPTKPMGVSPTKTPISSPSETPTAHPTKPVGVPHTKTPISSPSETPTAHPTKPVGVPHTKTPTSSPSEAPSSHPSEAPSSCNEPKSPKSKGKSKAPSLQKGKGKGGKGKSKAPSSIGKGKSRSPFPSNGKGKGGKGKGGKGKGGKGKKCKKKKKGKGGKGKSKEKCSKLAEQTIVIDENSEKIWIHYAVEVYTSIDFFSNKNITILDDLNIFYKAGLLGCNATLQETLQEVGIVSIVFRTLFIASSTTIIEGLNSK
jgi:hypothetical protein